MKNITFKQFLISTVLLFVTIGILIGAVVTTIYYNNKIKLYNQYVETTEQLLNEIDSVHNICDTVCEGDTYEDYMDLYNKLK
jgi:alpha-N-acetylglucosamine transferase